MQYLFKKILTPFLLPMPVCLGIALVGLYFLWFTERQRIGKIFVSIGICSLLLLSSVPLSSFLLSPLETYYPVSQSEISAKLIVVLGGGCVPNPKLPVMSQLTDPSVARLVEGVRIYRLNPGSRMIFTGRNVSSLMADAAISLGVDKADIVIDSESKDTESEAKNVKLLVKDRPFVLVTSALHIPRALALFKKQGMTPYPVSAGYLNKGTGELRADMIFPGPVALYKSERAVYEYMGLLWAKLRGQI